MKKAAIIIIAAFLISAGATAYATSDDPTLPVRAYCLMEKATGEVLAEYNADEKMPPASVTKVMTLLLVMEAVEQGRISLDESVTCSVNAQHMGGSQIYIKEGEQFSVDELIKAVSIASANDAAVALAEHIAGSEDSFVRMMNERAKSLGMMNTSFVNCCGLDADGHLTTARDIAIMTRELLNHDLVRKYSQIWMDSVRDGAFGLTNTNKLLRSYNGITGMKTGFTSKAMYCMAATAERDGMELVSVVLNVHNSATRFESAAKLLDYGFANFALVSAQPDYETYDVPVKMGDSAMVKATSEMVLPVLVEKGKEGEVMKTIELYEDLDAPVEKGQTIGRFVLSIGGQEIGSCRMIACDTVERLGVFDILGRAFHSLIN